MSGFEVLAKLASVARPPEVAVVVHTNLEIFALLQVARLNGAQAVLQKVTASGDQLEQAVLKALARVQRDPKKS